MPKIAEPIYLLDFRNGQVRELDPADELCAEASDVSTRAQTQESKGGIRFAALGSPVDHKD